MFGFLNLDKPAGMTSRDCVNRIQKLVKPAKSGHAGTLDPLATGVLIVAVGPATRLISRIQDLPKIYRARFLIGVESDTEDTEGELRPLKNPPSIDRAAMEAVLPEFTGRVQQVPPRFSALKVNGKRAYALARRGREVSLAARPIDVYRLVLLSIDDTGFEMEIECGSGTYVRSLGRDIARRLGTGAVMEGLRRTAIGPFRVQEAEDLDSLNRSRLASRLVPPQQGLPQFPEIPLSNTAAEQLVFGTWPKLGPDQVGLPSGSMASAIDSQGRLLALVEVQDHYELAPRINFAPYWNRVDHRADSSTQPEHLP